MLRSLWLLDGRQLHSSAGSFTTPQTTGAMNLALVHDRLHIKSFWEKRIHNDTEHAHNEEERRNRSALGK
ncbi:hypothetical protein WMY93_000568 [Mugilogobius chulae]|uniref:Uncharacterized protein n=1 Tax=Mugilogobius chulae TaxID=88201 RepID=A0AAW0Q9R3_9GOBI